MFNQLWRCTHQRIRHRSYTKCSQARLGLALCMYHIAVHFRRYRLIFYLQILISKYTVDFTPILPPPPPPAAPSVTVSLVCATSPPLDVSRSNCYFRLMCLFLFWSSPLAAAVCDWKLAQILNQIPPERLSWLSKASCISPRPDTLHALSMHLAFHPDF